MSSLKQSLPWKNIIKFFVSQFLLSQGVRRIKRSFSRYKVIFNPEKRINIDVSHYSILFLCVLRVLHYHYFITFVISLLHSQLFHPLVAFSFEMSRLAPPITDHRIWTTYSYFQIQPFVRFSYRFLPESHCNRASKSLT
jgi:hypothetical protein